ncbi:4Fe-4S dicluster domain-containing protein [Desulfocurvus sp. DL9XJH121]
MDKTFLIDMTRCTACRGCQVACKQWHKFPATKTENWGSYQNPKDLSFVTYKLVRFSEATLDGKLNWLFFPEQCRHCLIAPCKEVADGYVEGAILRDELTGAVLYTDLTAQLSDEEKQEVREACPYDIPRIDKETGRIGKCDMCIDRVHNGMKPACVQTCPTGCMNFGDREEMLELAEEHLAAAKKRYPKARLVDADEVNVIYLAAGDPALYHQFLAAEAQPAPVMGRRRMMARFLSPLRHLT